MIECNDELEWAIFMDFVKDDQYESGQFVQYLNTMGITNSLQVQEEYNVTIKFNNKHSEMLFRLKYSDYIC